MSIQLVSRQKNEHQVPTLLYLLLFSHLAMILSLSIGLVQVERICSYAILLLSFCIYVYSYIQDHRIFKQDMVFILFLLYLFVLAITYSWRYDDIKVVLVFLPMLTVWRGAGVVPCNQRTEKVLLNFFSVQGLILIALYFTPLAYKSYQEYVLISSELTLGFANPNQTGIIIFSTLAILLILMRRFSLSKLHKIILLIQIIALSILLVLTNARTSMLGYLLFLIFFMKKKKVKIHSLISGTVICFPIFFVYLYDTLSKTTLQDLTFLGKKLFSGRQRVFEEVLSMFTNKLFGNLSYFGFQNSHNALLTVLVNIGVVGLILYLVFTIMSFNSTNHRCKANSSFMSMIAILTFFIMGCAETAVLTGGTIYYAHMFVILILSNNTEIKENESQTI